MKINGITTNSSTGSERPVARAVKEAPASTSESDVQLSKVSAQFGSQPEVNSVKVQEIRQAILEGRFLINSSAIADRLLSSARELINSGPRS